MSKTKNEIELEIRVRALEDLVVEMSNALRDYRSYDITELPNLKMKYFNGMKAK